MTERVNRKTATERKKERYESELENRANEWARVTYAEMGDRDRFWKLLRDRAGVIAMRPDEDPLAAFPADYYYAGLCVRAGIKELVGDDPEIQDKMFQDLRELGRYGFYVPKYKDASGHGPKPRNEETALTGVERGLFTNAVAVREWIDDSFPKTPETTLAIAMHAVTILYGGVGVPVKDRYISENFDRKLAENDIYEILLLSHDVAKLTRRIPGLVYPVALHRVVKPYLTDCDLTPQERKVQRIEKIGARQYAEEVARDAAVIKSFL